MGLTVSTEVGAQASAIASWFFVSAAPLSIGAVVQWLRSASHSDHEDRQTCGRFLAKLLTFAAVASLLAGLVCLAISRRSQMGCCY